MSYLGRHPEGPDEDADGDLLDDSEFVVAKCPKCGGPLFEDADRCNHCGHWIIHHSSIWEGRGLWYLTLALLGVAAVIYFWVL